MQTVRVLLALTIVGGLGWLLGTTPSYRPTSLNLWLSASVAAASLAVVNVWRSSVPRGSSTGPMVLLVCAVGTAVVGLWDTAEWIPAAAVVLVFGLAVLLALSATGSESTGRPSLVTFAWVPRPRRWNGALPAVTKATVVLGTARLDLCDAELVGETDLNVTVILGRLEVVVPDGWPVTPHPTAGFGLRLGGVVGAGTAGPPLHLRVLGAAGVVEIRRRG